MRPLGLTGLKRSGKDAAAAHLVRAHGYARRAFADALKYDVYDKLTRPYFPTVAHWLTFIEAHKEDGPEQDTASVRPLLQGWGTLPRALEGQDTWAKRVLIEPGIVVSDVRFPDEVAHVRRQGGLVVRIERPGLVCDGHASERFMAEMDVDVVIANDGTLDDLYARLDALVGECCIP